MEAAKKVFTFVWGLFLIWGMVQLATIGWRVVNVLVEPLPGYVKDQSKWWPFAYTWEAGQKHRKLPHIKSAPIEGNWRPDPGYKFVSEENSDGTVAWQVNYGHASFEHVRTTTREGQWIADPGYVLKDSGEMVGSSIEGGAIWAPGRVHPDCPKVVAGKLPDRWDAAPGYLFTSDKNLTVVAVRQETVADDSSAVIGEAVVNGFIGLVAHWMAKPKDDDGAVSTAGKWAVGQVGDHFGQLAVDGAIRAFNGSRQTRMVQVGLPIPCEFTKTIAAAVRQSNG